MLVDAKKSSQWSFIHCKTCCIFSFFSYGGGMTKKLHFDFFFQGRGVETFVSQTWRSPRGYLFRLSLLSLIFLCKCCGIKSSWQALISLLYAGMLQNQGGLWSLPRTTWPGKGKFCQNGRQGPMSEWHLPSGTYSGLFAFRWLKAWLWDIHRLLKKRNILGMYQLLGQKWHANWI